MNTDHVERLTLTVEEVAELLGISRATAYTLAKQGRLPALRISERRIVIPRQAIMDYLASATMKVSTGEKELRMEK